MRTIVSILLIFAFVTACSSSVKPEDIRECRLLVYGENNPKVTNVDTRYKACLERKNAERSQQNKQERTIAAIEFLFELFGVE